MHRSLKGLWWLLEYLPKKEKWKRWPQRTSFMGYYLPRAEPRLIPVGAILHQSVLDRLASQAKYDPTNLPAEYLVEPLSTDLANNRASAVVAETGA
jgi:hypothetical protein